MDQEADRYRMLSRRAVILGGGQLALVGLLGARMYQLQILDSDEYQLMAEQNRIDLRLISPLRGRILDRQTEELATNRLSYRVSIIEENSDNMVETLVRLSNLIPLSDETIRSVVNRAKRTRAFLPLTVAENLSWEEFSKVNAHLTDLPGIYPDAGQSRFYPFANDFSLLVGYVGPVTEKELDDLPENPAFLMPEFRIGKRGLEQVHDEELRGEAGIRRVEVNALGREIQEIDKQDGISGEDLRLTIDRTLQQHAMNVLGEQSASAVVMNVRNGEVLVMASAPGFDANDFNHGISHENWNALLHDPRKPLLNKTVQGRFPPGSTFKMVVAAAALESGAIRPGFQAFCSGKMNYGNHTFHCWKRGGHGTVDVHTALEQSCDTFFYELAKRLDVDVIADMARRFGFGDVTGVGIDHETAGIVPTRLWKKQTTGQSWLGGESLNLSIGQGHMTATPMQLALMTARIANGGYDVQPTLMLQDPLEVDLSLAAPASLGISDRTMEIIQKGMVAVTEGPRGTARASKLNVNGHRMAGKTGTAQVRRITQAERDRGLRKDHEKPWEERDHSLFVGYAPIDDPVYAVAVVVQHGGSGSKVAAPMSRDILAKVLELDPSNALPPTDQPMPGVAMDGEADHG